MDEVTSKLKKLFKSKPKGFKGSGQKLGSTSQFQGSGQKLGSTSQAASSANPVPARRYAQQPNVREKSTPPMSKRPLGLNSSSPTELSDVPPASVVTTGAYVAPEEEKATDEQQTAFDLLKAAPQRAAAAEVLSKVLRNIVDHSTEAKYRKLKLNNKKVQQAVVNVDGGLELLQASGFELVFDESSPEPQAATSTPPLGSDSSNPASDAALSYTANQADSSVTEAVPSAESATTGYLWFPEEAELWLLQAALQLLQPLIPLPFSKPSSGGRNTTGSSSISRTASNSPPMSGSPALAPTAPSTGRSNTDASGASVSRSSSGSAPQSAPINLAEPRDRKTQVLLPAETDAQVPDWVFQQSPTELKQAFTNAKKKREMDSMLMTRAYREKLAGGKTQKGTYIYAVIRVRLPEGLMLQGEFNAREPVTAIFEWVSDSLRDPSLTYELILPTRRPLVSSMGRVSDADLLPSALLNLRFDTPSGSPQMPSLQKTLLQHVQ